MADDDGSSSPPHSPGLPRFPMLEGIPESPEHRGFSRAGAIRPNPYGTGTTMGARSLPGRSALSALILTAKPRRGRSGEDEEPIEHPHQEGGMKGRSGKSRAWTAEEDPFREMGSDYSLLDPKESTYERGVGMLRNFSSTFSNWLRSPRRGPVTPPSSPHLTALDKRADEEDTKRDKEPAEKRKGRQNLPLVKKHQLKTKSKDKLEKALSSARILHKRGLKDPSIVHGFSANSSRGSKDSKRKTLGKMLEALTGGAFYVPLNVNLLKALASVLQEAGYQAGDGYLLEAKLWHVEEGHPWNDQLDRVFKQCKRALCRGQGPRKKAMEVTKEMREATNRAFLVKSDRATRFTRELFRFAMVWMLRELELANIDTEDLKFEDKERRVSLLIRVSKTDSEASGVVRTLQCLCRDNECEKECPYQVSKDLVKKVSKFAEAGAKLALMRNKTPATKDQVINSWRWMFDAKVSGHSARRTGALGYIRAGYSITQVGYLGRWKSSAILSYAEEALEQLPANLDTKEVTYKGDGGTTVQHRILDDQELKDWKTQLKAEVALLRKQVREQGQESEEFQEFWNKIMKENQTALPKKVQSISGKLVHWNLTVPATSPPVSWKTMCGWYFYGSNFVFVDQAAPLTCMKCVGLCAKSQ